MFSHPAIYQIQNDNKHKKEKCKWKNIKKKTFVVTINRTKTENDNIIKIINHKSIIKKKLCK